MGGGGGDDHSGSMFHVGDNVELSRVLVMVSILVVFIMIFERYLHKLEHHLHKYPKYHEMMTKVFGELMILGLIGLGIKILKELTRLNAYSKPVIAFQAADLTIFLVAIALILQATVVFLRMRFKNIQVDKAELISTQHLVDLIAATAAPRLFQRVTALCAYKNPQDRKKITSADIPEVAQMRILRHYFLRSYGLPELFPFSKYLRQAQDNQISNMIEVEMSTWIVLLLIAWGMEAVSQIAKIHWTEKYSIVVAFLAFTWLSVALHAAITAYFDWAINELLNAATGSGSRHANHYLYLTDIAEYEAQAMDRELATDAIAVMERVREDEQLKHSKRKHKHVTHDTGFQLVATISRNVRKSAKKEKLANDVDVEQEAGPKPGTSDAHAAPTSVHQINLRWFSRKAWHFIVMAALMLNALYVALFCQCVIYQMRSIKHEFGTVVMCFIPVPLLINVFIFQPRIFRNFILVSSIFRVDDTALGEVIDHFTATVQLRANFVKTIHAYLDSTNQTIADIQNEFESRDVDKSGFLELEEVRLVLKRFGFKLSFFKFNSVARLLFDLQGIDVEYAQVLRLLEFGRSDEVRAFANSTLYTGETPYTSSSIFGVDSTETPKPYVPDADTVDDLKPRDGMPAPMMRAKSSAAASLYRMNWTSQSQSSHPANSSSPNAPQYLRM